MENLDKLIKETKENLSNKSTSIRERDFSKYHEKKKSKIVNMLLYWLNRCSDRQGSDCTGCKRKEDCTLIYDGIINTYDRLSKHPIKEK